MSEKPKTLNEQNRLYLLAFLATNLLIFLAAVAADDLLHLGWEQLPKKVGRLVPGGVGLLAVVVLNGFLSSDQKARLVFLRWTHALPGHRAFSKYGKQDPRVDLKRIEAGAERPLPTEPLEQNQMWYGFLRTLDRDSVVRHSHGRFLLLRDYTALAALCLLVLGALGFYAIPSLDTAAWYSGLLFLQLLLVQRAAAMYGIRLVTTVLARIQFKQTSRDKAEQA